MVRRQVRPPLLPAFLRRPALVTIALAALVVVAISLHVTGASWASRPDLGVGSLVTSHRVLHAGWTTLAVLIGSPPVVLTVAATVAVGALATRRFALAVLAVLGPGLTGVATTLLKPVIGRTIEGEYAFPSGHTGGAAAIGLVLAIAVLTVTRPGRVVTVALLVGLPLLLGAATGVAMVAAGAHYPTDTVGGFGLALVAVLGCALVTDRLAAGRNGGAAR